MRKPAASLLFCLLVCLFALAWRPQSLSTWRPLAAPESTPTPLPCDCKGQKKIVICHAPPGNPENAHTIDISCNGQNGHQHHAGDYCGPCRESTPEPTQGGGDSCPQRTLTAPAVTHGLTATNDLFALSQPVTLTITSPSIVGASTFDVIPASSSPAIPGTFGLPISNASMGASVGLLTAANLKGLSFSTAGQTLTAVSCLENLWDINLVIAGTGATAGDSVRLFLRNPDGSIIGDLARFAVVPGGVTLTQINSDVRLFLENRLASGAGNITLALPFIPFVATPAGSVFPFRTGVLTLAFTMPPGSLLNGCNQLGVEITRGVAAGTTAVVLTDIVVNRSSATTSTGTGLLSGTAGATFPTAPLCDAVCPICPVASAGNCPQNQFTASAVTHGTGGDLFFLPQPLLLTLVSPSSPGAGIVIVSNPTPDKLTGFLPGTTPQGLGLSTPCDIKALSCSDSFWDVNLELRSTGAVGDQIKLFLRDPGTGQEQTIALFTVQANGFVVTDLSSSVTLFHNTRLANGNQLFKNDVILASPGGPFLSSGLLTLAMMGPNGQSLGGCFQLGIEVTRAGAAAGTTLAIIADVVVNRTQTSSSSGPGLLFGGTGQFPTGLPCNVECPACP